MYIYKLCSQSFNHSFCDFMQSMFFVYGIGFITIPLSTLPYTKPPTDFVFASANNMTRCNLFPAVATSECCSGRELRHRAQLIISNPFCRSVSYFFGLTRSLGLWQGITEGRGAVEKGKKSQFFYFISSHIRCQIGEHFVSW